MKSVLKKITFIMLSLVLLISTMPSANAAFTAPVSTIKVGLYYTPSGGTTQKSFPSANLQNRTGYGYGYEFGYYDADRQFISLDARIEDTNKITMMMDKNMTYSSSSNSYSEGTSGSVVVGCFHIRLETEYPDYASARAAADTFTSVNAFVRYENGGFYVLVGEYISSAEAASAAANLGISQSYAVDSGTAYTVTVVATGTDKILFEFDYGTTYSLAVRPLSVDGEKPQTYFKYLTYYGDFSYIRAYSGNLTVVNYVDIEDYVKGLLPSEMSASWPLEALKAQAVCARTYAMINLNKHKSLGFDICNTTDCQVYEGTVKATENSDLAAEETAGMYLTYDGELCETYYYSCNGGASENSENVWTTAKPYLVGVIDPYEADVANIISQYNWTATFTGAQIAAKLQAKGYSCSSIVKFEILEFTPMGNVRKIRFTDSNGKTFTFSKEECRTFLGLRSQRYTINGVTPSSNNVFVNSAASFISGLLSDLFAIGSGGIGSIISGDVYAISGSGTVDTVGGSSTAASSGSTFVITGSGWGHNVGMSQWGAYSMAKYHNMSYDEILSFYYTGAELTYSIS